MKVLIVGLGIQGKKRLQIAGTDAMGSVDPQVAGATYRHVEEVPLTDYDAALVCTPDAAKWEVLSYLLSNGKHLLVEKPLFLERDQQFLELERLAASRGVACYTAYNHRFEPHLMNAQRVVQSGKLGDIYYLRMFYGNGTARDVRNSPWRDKGLGVFPDLGSHLLDTTLFLLGTPREDYYPIRFNRWENKAFDHVIFGTREERPFVQLEASLFSWRNSFYLDIVGERGSVHVECLCKWGPSILTVRERVLPSGRPPETREVIESADPTWKLEYDYFKELCKRGETNLANDRWINRIFNRIASELPA